MLRFRSLVIILCMALLIFCTFAFTIFTRSTHATHAAGGINGLSVSVGYAEDKHQSTMTQGSFPVPWSGSPNVIFLGSPVYGAVACGPTLPSCYDSGAIRLDNTSATAIAVSSVSVDDHSSLVGGKVFNLWAPFTVPAGKSVILTENNPNLGNFDTSGAPKGNCTPITIAPTVTITVNGVPTTLVDSTHVLDTNGIDQESCSVQQNESIQWRHIGVAGVKTATLTLSPAATTLGVGQNATVTATLLDGSSIGLANATINFTVTGGPNVGQTGSAVTDSTGSASFTYIDAAPGTDTVQASVNTATTVGPYFSNQISVLWTSNPTQVWSGWSEVPGNGFTLSAPATASYNGKDYVFVRGTNNRIYLNSFNGTTWSGWSPVPGNGSTPSALRAATYKNTLYLFVRGTNNRIYLNSFNGATWSGWSPVPGNGSTYDTPGAVLYGSNLDLFVRVTNNSIYMNTFNGTIWSGWSPVPGNQSTLSGPTVAINGSNLDLFVRGTNNGIYVSTFNGTTWSGWSPVPGNWSTFLAPTATLHTFKLSNILYLFVTGTDDKLYANTFNGASWSGWSPVPGNGSTPDAPGVSALATNLYLFVRGTNDRIYVNILH
jgi:hypothetical protein